MEWQNTNEVTVTGSEYAPTGSDLLPTGAETLSGQQEYADMPEEYFTASSDVSSDTKEKRTKRLRKIVYGITAAAAVAVISHTALGIPDDYLRLYYTNSPQAVWGNADILKTGGRNFYYSDGTLGEFQHSDSTYGTGNQQDMQRKINQYGNMLFNSASSGILLINTDGEATAVWREVFATESVADVLLSDNNIVYQNIAGNPNVYASGVRRHAYYKTNGELLYTTPHIQHGYQYALGGSAFREGKALCYDGNGLVMVSANGSTEYLVEWPTINSSELFLEKYGLDGSSALLPGQTDYTLDNVPCTVVDGLSKDYFTVIDTLAHYTLVQAQTKEVYPVSFETAPSFVPANGATFDAYTLKSYADHVSTMYHNGPLVCLDGTQDYLVDVTKHYNGSNQLTGCLACFDEIFFSEDTILPVRQGSDYFYINTKGETISLTYQKASTFCTLGYALAMETDGTVYVIDRSFRKVKRVNDVIDFEIQACGEVFTVTPAPELIDTTQPPQVTAIYRYGK